MNPIPDELLHGPFLRSRALESGVTARMLRSSRFVRIYPCVWRHSRHEMSDADWRAAARLALPARAHLTGVSRLQALGLDFGAALPVHFVIQGDLHLHFENVVLHRTVMLPPVTEHGVGVEATYLCYLTTALVIDAIKVGDWLVGHAHLDLDLLADLALGQPWRAGSHEAGWIIAHLDGESRSLRESETRSLITFASLPAPAVNVEVPLLRGTAIGDLVYLRYRFVVEYEGEHHQTDRGQYSSDIDRYKLLRDSEIGYLQLTKEDLGQPRRLVRRVHAELVARGYDGPAPCFESQWEQLFGSVRDAAGPRLLPLGRKAS